MEVILVKLIVSIFISRHKKFLIVCIKPLSLGKSTIKLEHILANLWSSPIGPVEVVAPDSNLTVLVFKDEFIVVEVGRLKGITKVHANIVILGNLQQNFV